MSGWENVHNSLTDEIHVIPFDDLMPHTPTLDCRCRPVRDEESPRVVIHNSADQREAYERGERPFQ